MDPAEGIRRLRVLLYSMPLAHISTLLYLLDFFHQIERVPDNMMGSENLGIVLGPVLLRPEEETIQTA
eukprot:CAMPEP_0119150256 /NCGR_PEP_ID=MMETSP1310-20130426/44541_1 /TAXON_ID=464262 /ORGANISM="Genus nov. species nov., Strain RCC2339" /LENGTH=67 /DNA_ID=CAMNT_0007142427 /DNA_START=1 /DNA_END=200 /DNA_ORIENTATION=-